MDDPLFLGLIIIVILVIIIWWYNENSKFNEIKERKQAFDYWENKYKEEFERISKTPAVLNSKSSLLQSICELEALTAACYKCGEQLFNILNLNRESITIRCTKCKKKIILHKRELRENFLDDFIDNLKNFEESLSSSNYHNFYLESYRNHDFDFESLRKGYPSYRDFEVWSNLKYDFESEQLTDTTSKNIKRIERNTKLKTFEDSYYDYISIYEDNFSLTTLGNLERVRNDLFLNCFNLVDLGNLNKVGGNCNIRNSQLKSIENLHVKGNLNISYEEIEVLQKVKVDGIITFPSHWKGKIELIDCELNKVRHQKSKRRELNKSVFPNFPYFELSVRKFVDLKKGKIEIEFFNDESEVLTSINNPVFQKLKSELYSNKLKIEDYNWSSTFHNFHTNLINELLYNLKNEKISRTDFIKSSLFITKQCLSIFKEKDTEWEYFRIQNNFFIDYYRLNDRYDLAHELLILNAVDIDFATIHDLEFNLKKRILNGEILFNQFGLKSLLNKYTQDNLELFKNFLDEVLEDIYLENYSYFYSLFKKNKSISEINSEFPQDYPRYNDYQGNSNQSKKAYDKEYIKHETCKSYKKVRNKFPKKSKKLWVGSSSLFSPCLGEKAYCFNYFLERLILEIFSSIVYNSENEFRVSRGVPRIGEGWVSETNLYYELKSHFENDTVIHHGKPKWLGKQHIDIWFPKHKIGVEYQGKQHYEPIEFFGGEEQFKKNQERDRRKKRLFKEHNATLIEVTSGYNLDEVISKIENDMNNK